MYDTIVTDHLINKNQSATLEDQSNLTDIKNVKGSEEFSQNGEKLTWQADGADIYYQGKTDSEAPVSLKLLIIWMEMRLHRRIWLENPEKYHTL